MKREKLWGYLPRNPLVLASALWLLLILPVPALAGAYVQSFAFGRVDWSIGVAEAAGTVASPVHPADLSQARATARAEAVSSARRHLLEVVGRISIDSRTSVRDLMAQSEAIHLGIKALLEHSIVKEVSSKPNGTVKAVVAIDLTGPFAEFVLPNNIRAINAIQQPQGFEKGEEGFTGLIVACLGFKAKPAMVPQIFDEDGELVYGSPYISRDYAVELGTVGYAQDLAAAQRDLRVASRPLTVKGMRTAKMGPSDIVISSADAAKIRGTASHLKLLQRCRVVIVLD